MKYIPIVPAVIPRSEAEIKDFAQKLTFSKEFHLDVVDGKFVPSVSWPVEPDGDPVAVKTALDPYTLEVDLMVVDPLSHATSWVIAGADMLVFHIETLPVEAFAAFAESTPVSVGISCHGDTSFETLCEYAVFADYVQLMGIYEIGAQGQPFYEGVIDTIIAVKKKFPHLSITVDGSVNADTITRLYAAGADRFIAGSAIVQQPDPAQAHQKLQALINGV